MKYLFMVGMALVIFGICFLVTFRKEKAKRYIVVQGKVIEVVKSLGVGKGFTYTPIFEYQYNNKTFRVAHRISSFTPNCTYKVNDVVELRVYEDKPDKAIAHICGKLCGYILLPKLPLLCCRVTHFLCRDTHF